MRAAAATQVPSAGPPAEYVISVRNVGKYFPIKKGVLQRVAGHVKAVDGVTFDVRRGETVGLVGESGCGKSTLGRCIAGLFPPTSGGVYFGLDAAEHRRLDALLAVDRASRTAEQRRELADLDRRHRIDAMDRRHYAGYRRNCQVVFQNNFSSLNPRHLAKDIVGRPLKIHHEASGGELLSQVIGLLESVGLGREHLFRYPHQFSGGQRQRIAVARALALRPEFVVLDEPTSALDVSVQAQILNMLHELQRDLGLTYLFISHDLDVVRHMADRIVVMYVGQVCEIGTAAELFGDPQHPYTEALLDANPSLEEKRGPVIRLAGAVPDPASPPQGCRFHTRCPVAFERCGWDVDDAVGWLERRPDLFPALQGVKRSSPFAAEFAFDDAEKAAAAAAGLRSPEAPEGLRGALLELQVDDQKVRLSFAPVDEVRLGAVHQEHATACLRHGSAEAGGPAG
jgi:oligopeptide/dipeptide ABC transporter ATP-binding protein